MKTKVEICHIDTNRCVVRVSGFDGERDLGSALGEGADAEEAEDRARQRLEERNLKGKVSSEPKRNPQPAIKQQGDPRFNQQNQPKIQAVVRPIQAVVRPIQPRQRLQSPFKTMSLSPSPLLNQAKLPRTRRIGAKN